MSLASVLQPSAAVASRRAFASRLAWAVVALAGGCAVALRFYGIDRLPGINGDEPQYAVHARAFLQGAPLSTLRTGSDLPMNPVFFSGVVLLQAWLPATLWSLRFAAVLQSLACIALAWLLFRVRGRAQAALFAFFVAVLPLHLGYARFAWDPTAIPTASVLALAAAVRLRVLPTLLAFGLCVWVHPTMVFLLPVLVAPFVVVRGPRLRALDVRVAAASLIGLGVAVALAWLLTRHQLLPSAVLAALSGDRVTQALSRAQKPAEFVRFLAAYVELLSGPTIYRYIVGSLAESAARAHFWAASLVLVPVAGFGTRQLIRRRNYVDLGVALGLGVALVVEYLVAGPSVLAPKTERYAVCLTIPACYLLASWVVALSTTPRRAIALRVASAAVGGALLASFWFCYVGGLYAPNAQREDTFRTGELDPKRSALREILRTRDPSRTTLIYVEDWWIYWTIRYLAPPETGVRVMIHNHPWDYRFPRDFELPAYDPQTMELFGVVWADRSADRRLSRLSVSHIDVHGYEPAAILRVHRLEQPNWDKPRTKRKRHERHGAYAPERRGTSIIAPNTSEPRAPRQLPGYVSTRLDDRWVRPVHLAREARAASVRTRSCTTVEHRRC